MAWEYFLDKLQSDFGERAEKQLDIAIIWGRHAELFAYDADTQELYLESDEGKVAEKTLSGRSVRGLAGPCPCRSECEGFELLQQDDAEDFYLHLSPKDKTQLTLACYPENGNFGLRLIGTDEAAGCDQRSP